MKFVDWGLIEYGQALQQQMEFVEQLKRVEAEETIIFCSHHPVVTVGRKTNTAEIKHWDGAVYEIGRGGRATYHGPDQLIIYPILDLKKDRKALPSRDVHRYLKFLEQVVVESLNEFGVSCQQGSESGDQGDLSRTGVWANKKKIASIGIGVKNWITFHGIAINVLKNDSGFSKIQPCGFDSSVMTSLEDIKHEPLSFDRLKKSLRGQFKRMDGF